MMKSVVLVVLLAYSATASFWSGCSDIPDAVVPIDITSSQCSDTKCTMTRGEPLNAHVAFNLVKDHDHLKVAVKGTMYGLKIDLYDKRESE
jgi:hypothetical protein